MTARVLAMVTVILAVVGWTAVCIYLMGDWPYRWAIQFPGAALLSVTVLNPTYDIVWGRRR